ncbi:MAG: EpsG family protein [Ruminococcus sp.]|nr:EpsG family protein [Ruminococcus sp.]
MLRHKTIGTDTQLYIYYFERFNVMEWSEIPDLSLELGYSYYNKLISVFTDDPQVFLAITAVVISAMIYPTYRRLCLDPSLTIVLFCIMSTFVMMFSGIRQMIAIAIGFIAYEFTRKKKLFPFILAVAVAVMFHSSAFMLIFMYPLFHAKITKKWLYIIVPLTFVLFVFNAQVFSVLSVVLEHYTRFSATTVSTGAYAMIALFAVFALFSFFVPDEDLVDAETIGLRNFLLLSIFIQIFAPLHTLAMRMNYYYIIFIPLLLPKIIQTKSVRWRQVAIAGRYVMVVFFLLYFFVSASGEGALDVFPYHFFWEDVV